MVNDQRDFMSLLIQFIDDLYQEEFYEHHLCDGLYFFRSGGCYALAYIIKDLCGDSVEIMINNDYNHCAIKYNGSIYDIRKKLENDTDYKLATKEDENFMFDRFNCELALPVYKFLRRELPLCRIDRLIEEIKNSSDIKVKSLH